MHWTKSGKKNLISQMEQQQALQAIRQLLPTLPVGYPDGTFNNKILVSLGYPYPYGVITRVGPSEWNVNLDQYADMNCNDPECVINFFAPYRIYGVELNGTLYFQESTVQVIR
jgi:hypothetical protein